MPAMLNFVWSKPTHTGYGFLMLAGILVSIFFWFRLAHRDDRLVLIYVAALAGAFICAKLVYLAAEGWLHWHDEHRWVIWMTGKSITGALLGGYVAVEATKRLLDYTRATGDWFAVIAPLGIMIGRVGCILQGCCLGRPCARSWFTMDDPSGIARWPSALVELLFNGFFLASALLMKKWRILPGQHFHLYMMAYGIFRFAHEFVRDTPRILGPLTGYQLAALAVTAVGAVGFYRRSRSPGSDPIPLSAPRPTSI